MNKINSILFFMLLIVSFSSCEISEPENKPDFAQPASEMFYFTSTLISNEIRLFDKLLFLESYLNMDDSIKQVFKNQYFQQYEIVHPISHIYLFVRNSDNDTIYTILTDTNSIHLQGAVWKIKEQYQDSFSVVNCKGNEKWEMHKVEDSNSKQHRELILQLQCRDSVPAILFQNTNFGITGNGVSENINYGIQNLRISFQIKDTLVYQGEQNSITEGSININADDDENNKHETTNGRYFVDTENESNYEITYHNRTRIYKTYNSFWLFW
ncbi:MAG: hypothetical protein PHS59_05020 [Paludibacter sp.]|nr:hypothetical protein [Paludibacter sp.]